MRFLIFAIFSLAAISFSYAQAPRSADPPKLYSPDGLTPLPNDQLKRLNAYPFDVVICKNNQIPSGYVIVGEGSSISCPGSFPNTWTIKPPGVTEVVCKVSPIPSNYVIQGEGSSISCPGSFPNTLSIRHV